MTTKRWTILAAIALVLVLAATAAAQAPAVRVVVNGKDLVSDVPAQIVNDRTMIPLRAVSEAMAWRVGWDPTSRTATITDPAVLSETQYKKALAIAVLQTAVFAKRGAEASTPAQLQEGQKYLTTDRGIVIAFSRLRPPASMQEAHVVASAMLANAHLAERSLMLLSDIRFNGDKYDDSSTLTLSQAAIARGRAASTAANELVNELVRLVPEANDAKSVTTVDLQWFLDMLWANYPEGWPK